MRHGIILTALLSLLTLAGCGRAVFPSGNIVNESRNIAGFDAIDVSGGIRVTVNNSSSESVEVEADDNVIGYVETYLSGNTLVIKIRDGIVIRRSASIKVTVSSPSIGAIAASGGSTIECPHGVGAGNLAMDLSGGSRMKGKFTLDDLAMSLSGGSKMEGTLRTDLATISLSGGSVVSVNGSSRRLTLSCSGGSITDGFGFTVTDTAIELSGGSVVKLTVDGDITIDAAGGSKLIYHGKGDVLRQSLTGGSTVSKQ